MTSIKLIVTGASARAEVDGLLTSGMVGIPVTIVCDGAWDGLTKALVCRAGSIVKTILNVRGTATVAHECMVPNQTLFIGIEGRNADGTLVIPTVWARCGLIFSGATTDADPSADPTLPVWAQIGEKVGNLDDLNTQAKENLVAAINEAMTKGVDVSGASVGQIIKVAAVDDAGNPTEWETVDLPEQVQTDWNQNDDTQHDYLKNRPFYIGTRNVTVENAKEVELNNFPVFAVGDTVTVNVDGVEHSLVAYDDEGDAAIGDTYSSVDNGEGQLGWNIYVDGSDEVWFYANEAHTVSYSVEEVVKIDEKYLPPISKQVVYDLSNAVFKGIGTIYYFVDPTTLTDILKSINTGSPMPYIGFKDVSQSMRPYFIVNVCINFGWGTSMNAKAVDVLGMSGSANFHVYIFDTFEHAKEYYER